MKIVGATATEKNSMMPTLAAVMRSLIWVSILVFGAGNVITQRSEYRLLARVFNSAEQKIRPRFKTNHEH